jgi:phosphate:Na+ symporter
MYDIIGSTVFGTLILTFPFILNFFTTTWESYPAQQAAMFHTFYNVATMILLLPFIKYVALMMQKIVPIVEENTNRLYEKKLVFLVDQMSKSPSMAVYNARMEICRMWGIANENLSTALDAFFERSEEKAKTVFENEKTLDYLHQTITAALVEVTNLPLTRGDAKKVSDMFVILAEIEQIGDRAENIAESVINIIENKLEFTDDSIEELKLMYKSTKEILEVALKAYDKQDLSNLREIARMEQHCDDLESTFIQKHFARLKEKQCDIKSGVVFTDTLNDLEKCADRSLTGSVNGKDRVKQNTALAPFFL